MSTDRREQVIALGRLGWSLRRIEAATGVRRETASVYLRQSGVALRAPGGWGHRGPSKPANEVITDSESTSSSKPAKEVTTGFLKEIAPALVEKRSSASASEPYREWIEQELSGGRNAMGIWQDLVDGHGFTEGYQSVKRFASGLRGSRSPEARVIIETAPGEECQVDYGTGPMVRDAETGKYRRTRLDNFDFQFNPKLNRALVFDLATAGWVGRREDALFLGPPGSGKSHIAQAIGHAVIQQGYRVLYREAHVLLEELADATLDGKRKEHVELLATVPLLVIDDLGMRKLPVTAAEELLEIIMRRYERASTLITSNRPVEDWGKLLGDSAAVTAMLDRLLHHGHVIKCGPRSWRTKTGAPGQSQ